MTEKCLLIKTKDERQFLTSLDNLEAMLTFAQTFKAQIFFARVKEDQPLLKLKALTAALCNPEYSLESEFKVCKRIFPAAPRSRSAMLKEARQIREFIQKHLIDNKLISLKQVKNQFKQRKLTDACLCNHLTNVRKLLSTQGFQIIKQGAGVYCLVG